MGEDGVSQTAGTHRHDAIADAPDGPAGASPITPFEAWLIAGAPAAALSVAVVATAEPLLAAPLAMFALAAFLPVRAMVAAGGRQTCARPKVSLALATLAGALGMTAAWLAGPGMGLAALVLALFALDITQSRQTRLRYNPRPYGLGAMAFWAVPGAILLDRARDPDATLFGSALPHLAVPDFLVWAAAAFAALTLLVWLVERAEEMRARTMPSAATAADAAHLVLFVAGWGLAPTLEVAVLLGLVAFGIQGLMQLRQAVARRFAEAPDEDALVLSSFAPEGEGLLFTLLVAVSCMAASFALMMLVGAGLFATLATGLTIAAITLAALPLFRTAPRVL
jgi:hypothetical protein